MLAYIDLACRTMKLEAAIPRLIRRGRSLMHREYHKSYSNCLGREMELLVFGAAGVPVVVFPTSCGRFYDFEDRGMIAALSEKIDAGELQLFCVDSVDAESWYNRSQAPRGRIQRQLRYEEYLLHEALALVRERNSDPRLLSLGCSFGGYHAVNIALRHPELFSGFVSLSGVFDLTGFLSGYYDQECYYNLPTHYLPNLTDPRTIDRFRRNRYVLATGHDDQCLAQNRTLDRILNALDVPHTLHIWQATNSHDWPTWQQMVKEYL
jgi:esterase/lipase superfamily enzyme